MYYVLSLLAGVLVSAMIALNGGLSASYGVYLATVIIHLVTLTFMAGWVLVKRENPFAARYAWYLYIGGAVGVLTVLFNNLAFGRISVSAILALGLFGQGVCGLLVDQYGLLGMPRHPFRRSKLFGLSVVLAGAMVMITSFEIAAVILSLSAGVTIVASRTFNAKLAEFTSAHTSGFFNALVGTCASLPLFLLLGLGEIPYIQLSPNPFFYMGGLLGAFVVVISNVIVEKISAFYLSLLMFTGQVFAGVLIDILLTREFSPHILLGGVLVASGLCVNLFLDHRKTE